jgi:hypothetical protein
MEEDVVSITVSLLDTNWNASNCVKPQIIAPIEQYKQVDLADGDVILIYDTGPSMRAKGDILYSTEDFDSFVSIDIRTVASKSRLNALWTEVNRIRVLKRKDPHTDWHSIHHLRRTPLINKSVGLFRYVVDWRFVARKVAL